jgi:hypothetical protein
MAKTTTLRKAARDNFPPPHNVMKKLARACAGLLGSNNNTMAKPKSAAPKEMIVAGIVALAPGLYFVLVGAGVLPIPGGPGNLHGPLWIVLSAGLAFFVAGIAVLLQAFGGADDQGEFPAGSPMWLRLVQYLMGVAIFVSFAAIGSWIAFGPGERSFSGSFFFLSSDVNATIGRTAFGIGAIITWLGALTFAVLGARKLFGSRKPGP